jgi:hypothetical protein
MYAVLAVLMLILAGTPVQAEQFQEHGAYRIHYNSINTTLLSPNVAELHNIVRSKNRALLNLAVRKHSEDSDEAVAATVKVSSVNLAQQYKEINMREVREADAIYYIGVFTFSEGENLNFTVEITPQEENNPYLFKFEQQFFFAEF